jgi:hypothetical protein
MRLTNDELLAALDSKLRRGATYTAQDVTAFALGVEWAQDHLAALAAAADGQMLVRDLANRVCAELPERFVLRLCMERGAAWIELDGLVGGALPDAADKSVEKQVNDALCVACGW